MVPGRAAQHGRVAFHRALSRMGAEPDQRAEQASALRRARRFRGDRHRLDVEAPGAAQGAARRGAELVFIEPSCPRLSRTSTSYFFENRFEAWMAGTSPAMTQEETNND